MKMNVIKFPKNDKEKQALEHYHQALQNGIGMPRLDSEQQIYLRMNFGPINNLYADVAEMD